MTREVEVMVTYLELSAGAGRAGLVASPRALPGDIALRKESRTDAAAVAQLMYRSVGAAHHWVDRASWTLEQWRANVERDDIEVWTARTGDAMVGYYLLHVAPGSTEIKYFGLTPPFIGRGIGGPLLSAAVRRALDLGAVRVTLNTCSLDHPAALPNYLARGFRVVHTAVERRTLPS